MIRKLGSALIGLAIILPIVAAAPVAAHTSGGLLAVDFGTVTTGDGTKVVGYIGNHTSSRRSSMQVTATWTSGTTVMASQSGVAFVSNLAPHASSPFSIMETDDIDPAWTLTVTATGTVTGTKPIGGLHVELGEFVSENVYEGQVTNDGVFAAQDVQVMANREDVSITDAGASPLIPSIAPGASATYTITFADDSHGDVDYLIAKTNAGPFLTSWNNYFGDLGTTNFADAIVWMADEGITTGCLDANFCPKDGVTRAQMAVFLTRALDLPPAEDQGFVDLGMQSGPFIEAINSLAAAGISEGCSPDHFCPNRRVTRGEMSKFIVTGYGNEGGKDIAPIDGPGPFSDDNGHFSEPYNNAMFDSGITTGCDVGIYCRNAFVLREQMAIFLLRASQLPDAS